MKDLKSHWERVYKHKNDTAVSWYQEHPETSLKLVQKYAQDKSAEIIDIGGGNSFLAVELSAAGFTNISVLDISEHALSINRSRFKDESTAKWLITDVLKLNAQNSFFLWHDCAVFHFLTKENDILKYKSSVLKSLKSKGILILGTFSTTSPDSCSGLPVKQYDKEKLIAVFSPEFEIVESFNHTHVTPSGNPQNFIWSVFRKK